jgi:hypothetical protein
MTKITSINGATISTGEPNEIAVRMLEDALERAKSGDLVGVGIVMRHSDGCGSFSLGGSVGGYSMLGALEMVRDQIVSLNRGGA